MAKIQYGNGVSAMSGKLSGNVSARNKGGAYVRTWTKPTNPRSPRQQQARDLLSSMSNAWRTLTQTQQDSWAAWAATHPILDRLGNAIKLAANMAYVKININRTNAGDDATASLVPDDPVFVENIIDIDTPVVPDSSATTIIVTLGAGAAADQVVEFWASPLVSAGVNNTFPFERLVQVVTLTTDIITAGTVDIGPGWTETFGSFAGQIGKKIVVEAYQYDEGQISQGQKVSGLVVA